MTSEPAAHPTTGDRGPGRAFLHVGLQKTGTSYLQSHLWDSPEALRAMGVRMVPDNRGQAFHLMRDVRDRLVEGVHPRHAFASVDALTATVAAADEPTLVVSQESLAAATAEQAARLLGCFGERETHLVLTVRDIARQLPSLWQQKVKSSKDLSFSDFLDQVTAGDGVAESVWAQQDIAAVLDRWSRDLPPERVHVVTVPPPGAPTDELARRFGEVVGVDFTQLTATDLRRNISLDPAQTELVRRVNEVHDLGAKSQRARITKQFFAAKVLAPHRGAPARTPASLADWCRQVAEQQVAALTERGVSVSGALGDLVPTEESFGLALEPVSDEAVVDVAVTAIAELLVQYAQARRAPAVDDEGSQGTDGGHAEGRSPGPLGRLSRRLNRRLRRRLRR